MAERKGHRHKGVRRRGEPWPRNYIPDHTSGKCPYCKKQIKNIESHIKAKHLSEKPRAIKGKLHGHSQ